MLSRTSPGINIRVVYAHVHIHTKIKTGTEMKQNERSQERYERKPVSMTSLTKHENVLQRVDSLHMSAQEYLIKYH